MPSLLVTIFVVEAVVHFINVVGASTINNLLWNLINCLPISTSKANAEQRKLQAEYLKVRQDLSATSSQDEFAKWAKLRRQHDKLLDQLEKKKKSLEASKAKFDSTMTGLRLVLTRGPQYFVPFWYGKEPVFWLPHDWFPYWAEWIISFPRAPVGSVSTASWQLACTGAVTLLADFVTGLIGLVRSDKSKEAPVVGAGKQAEKDKVNPPKTAASEEKKEL